MTTKELQDISAAELRDLLSRPEHKVVVVDVRQPEEYELGHLPGALLLPLSELEADLGRLPDARRLVLYCQSGQRSKYAGLVAVQAGRENIYNLDGGILAWRDKTLTGAPALAALDTSGPLPDVIRGALELEKGAQRLYEGLLAEVSGTMLEPAMRDLAGAEVGHGRALHLLLSKLTPDLGEFDEVWGSLTGELLEGGQLMADVLAQAAPPGPGGRRGVAGAGPGAGASGPRPLPEPGPAPGAGRAARGLAHPGPAGAAARARRGAQLRGPRRRHACAAARRLAGAVSAPELNRSSVNTPRARWAGRRGTSGRCRGRDPSRDRDPTSGAFSSSSGPCRASWPWAGEAAAAAGDA